MVVLWEYERVTMSELCRYLYLDNGTLTPLIKRLITAGLVEKNGHQRMNVLLMSL
jgi:DNA-binding MarR family transcriptional regulator